LINKKILIVDDDKIILNILEKCLTATGYSVIKASNGIEGIKKAKSYLPDLIILDIMMPKMTGGDAANAIRQDPVTKNIPIIFLSSSIKKEEIISSKKGGVYLLSKPFTPKELLERIRRIFIE